MRLRAALLTSASVIAVVLSGCGGGHRQPPSICKPDARQLVAQTLRLSPGQVAVASSKGNNGMPQCTFRAKLPGGGAFALTVNVDTSPEPYMVLSRTIEERAQGFTPTSRLPAPVGIMDLGLLASWFPDESALMSTDGVRLLTATLSWSGVRPSAKVRLATRISRLYLGNSNASRAKLYP